MEKQIWVVEKMCMISRIREEWRVFRFPRVTGHYLIKGEAQRCKMPASRSKPLPCDRPERLLQNQEEENYLVVGVNGLLINPCPTVLNSVTTRLVIKSLI